ncbi:MAG TPA: hypothetical protein VM580_18120 [Labilithrix sp.]|nr:hypothetical protein [Labilithrix sp.]
MSMSRACVVPETTACSFQARECDRWRVSDPYRIRIGYASLPERHGLGQRTWIDRDYRRVHVGSTPALVLRIADESASDDRDWPGRYSTQTRDQRNEESFTMSIQHALIAAATLGVALCLPVRSAYAGVTTSTSPIWRSTTTQGTNYFSRTYAESGYEDYFGGSLEIYGRASAVDWKKACQSSKTAFDKAVYCTTERLLPADTTTYVAKGEASAEVTMFGKDFSLFEMNALAGSSKSSGTRSFDGSYSVYLAGLKFCGGSSTSTKTFDAPKFEVTLAQMKRQFVIANVPFVVKAQAVGSLGVRAVVTKKDNGVKAEVGPNVAVDAVASAGVGVDWVANFGIQGNLTLVDIYTPVKAEIAFKAPNWENEIAYDLGLDLTISSLRGSLGLYAEILGQNYYKSLFSWSGISYTDHLDGSKGKFYLTADDYYAKDNRLIEDY